MPSFKVLKSALFPVSLLLGTGSVLAGCAAAVVHGNLEVLAAILCLFFVWAAQLGSNVGHRFYDYKNGNIRRITTIPGEYVGSGFAGITTYTLLKETTYALSVLATMFGIALASFAGWWAFFFGIIIAFVAYLNNFSPFPIVRTPAGPVVTFLLFGPMCVIGTCLIQSQDGAEMILNWFDLEPAVYIGLAMGFLAANVHLCYLYMTYPFDIDTGVRTLLTRYGNKGVVPLFIVNTLLGTFFLGMLAVDITFSCPWLIWGVCAVPLLYNLAALVIMCRTKLISASGRTVEENDRLSSVNSRSALLTDVGFAVTGLLLFIVCLLSGTPDDSVKVFFIG